MEATPPSHTRTQITLKFTLCLEYRVLFIFARISLKITGTCSLFICTSLVFEGIFIKRFFILHGGPERDRPSLCKNHVFYIQHVKRKSALKLHVNAIK